MTKKILFILLITLLFLLGCTSESDNGINPIKLENEQSSPIEVEVKSLKTSGDYAIVELYVSRDVTTFNNSVNIMTERTYSYDVRTGEYKSYDTYACHAYSHPETKGGIALKKGINEIKMPCTLMGLEKTKVRGYITFYPEGGQSFERELEIDYDVWRNCTPFTGEDLEIIKLHEITPDQILFEIKHDLEKEVIIKDITGTPNFITWENRSTEPLKPKMQWSFILSGSFSEYFNEEITITYSVEGEEKTAKTTCSRILPEN